MEEKENKQQNTEEIIEENTEKKEEIQEEFSIDKLTHKEAKELLKKFIARESEFKEQAEKIAKNVSEIKAQTDDYKDKWMRTAAEFENYKKRTALTRLQSIDEGKTQILLKIIPLGDNLERALNLPMDEKTKEGIALLVRNFKDILEKEGLTEINPVGEKFDPNLHEALMQVAAEEGETSGNVKDVFIKGYKMGEKVIRYAQVRVIN